ncbi:Spy/CpxP family protein refolding chaperone [Falsiroseomonas sp.]|uniref:Spy/CpxP family protein refolding chaperone n=1 Tax=Falsiroseomonas sp. TaxID=2870721 RepID=UPI00356AEEC5
MRKLSMFTAAGILAFGLAGSALAQAPAPPGAASDPHHPEAPAATPQPAPPPAQRGAPTPGMAGPGGGMMGGGMMGGDMGRMMQPMMQQMMQGRMAAAAMQPFRRIEGQLAYFRAELRITDAQAQPWNAFAAAVRTQAERLRQATQQAMAGTTEPGPAPQQMERRIALLSAHLEAMRAVAAAATPLYEALSEEQRRTADELMAEHFRGMRMGMRMP